MRSAVWFKGTLVLSQILAFWPLSPLRAEQVVYLVDVQRVINESIIGKASRNDFEAEVKKSEMKLAQQKGELDKLHGEVDKQASLLSSEALEEKREVLDRRGREFERSVQDQREELSRKNDAEMLHIMSQIQKVVQELAAQGNYPVIMERDPRVVVYADPRLDLTDQVIKQLDAKKLQF